jgi:hypothetical protein
MINTKQQIPFYQDQNFEWRNLRGKLERISTSLVSTLPATAANFGVFYIATESCTVEEAWESHTVAGSDAGAVTLDIEKLTSAVALDSGVSVLATTFDLKSTANIPVRVGPTATIGNRQLARGDRLALKDTGTLTNCAGLTVTLIIKYKL